MAVTNQGKNIFLPMFLYAVFVSPQSEGVRGNNLYQTLINIFHSHINCGTGSETWRFWTSTCVVKLHPCAGYLAPSQLSQALSVETFCTAETFSLELPS